MSTEGWSFLEVEGVDLVGVSAVVRSEGWPVGRGWLAGGVGSGLLGLAAGCRYPVLALPSW